MSPTHGSPQEHSTTRPRSTARSRRPKAKPQTGAALSVRAPPPTPIPAPGTGDGGAALQRQAVVAVGADEEAVGAAQEVAQRLAQLGVAEVLVEAHQHGAHRRLQRRLGPVCGRGAGQVGGAGPEVRDPGGLQLGGERGAAQHVGGGAGRQGLAEVAGGAEGRAENVAGLGGREAEAPQLLGVSDPRAAAVVGHVAQPLARRRQTAQGCRRAAQRRLAAPQHAVAVEQQRVDVGQHSPGRLALQPPALPPARRRHGRLTALRSDARPPRRSHWPRSARPSLPLDRTGLPNLSPPRRAAGSVRSYWAPSLRPRPPRAAVGRQRVVIRARWAAPPPRLVTR